MIPPLADRFVAGETPAEAIQHAQELDDDGIATIFNLLGEHYDDRQPADEDAEAYLRLIEDIESTGIKACISIKPSQIGLTVGRHVFNENLERIVDHAVSRDVFVWIDMEDHTTTDATLAAFEEFAWTNPDQLGVCVQANLKRTRNDLKRLADVPGKVRLVKGAYDEPRKIAYKRKADVDRVYKERLTDMFETFDGGIAVGSHDPEMIAYAKSLHDEHETEFEVQMLMGVREDAQRELAREYEMWQYVPYGDRWLSYFYRRVMERKENMLFALRAIIGR